MCFSCLFYCFYSNSLPNDDIETNRLNLQHYLIRFVLEGYHKSPIQEQLKRGIRVLDAGCGTGVWSIEMAVYRGKR